jgi:hypothetical protein
MRRVDGPLEEALEGFNELEELDGELVTDSLGLLEG